MRSPMPLYDYECHKCGVMPDLWARIAEVSLNCPKCGTQMVRLISPSNIICDIEPYVDETLGPVHSRQHKMARLKEEGLAIK